MPNPHKQAAAVPTKKGPKAKCSPCLLFPCKRSQIPYRPPSKPQKPEKELFAPRKVRNPPSANIPSAKLPGAAV